MRGHESMTEPNKSSHFVKLVDKLQDKYLSHDSEYYYEANDVAMDLERLKRALQDDGL